jgi:hypothetical protein
LLQVSRCGHPKSWTELPFAARQGEAVNRRSRPPRTRHRITLRGLVAEPGAVLREILTGSAESAALGGNCRSASGSRRDLC